MNRSSVSPTDHDYRLFEKYTSPEALKHHQSQQVVIDFVNEGLFTMDSVEYFDEIAAILS